MENITIGQPIGIYMQIKDPIAKKSRALTVHGMSLDKLFYRIKFYLTSIEKYGSIRIVCNKKGDEIGEEKRTN